MTTTGEVTQGAVAWVDDERKTQQDGVFRWVRAEPEPRLLDVHPAVHDAAQWDKGARQVAVPARAPGTLPGLKPPRERKLSLALTGGFGLLDGNNVCLRESPSVPGCSNANAHSVGLEVTYDVHPNIALGLGLDYARGNPDEFRDRFFDANGSFRRAGLYGVAKLQHRVEVGDFTLTPSISALTGVSATRLDLSGTSADGSYRSFATGNQWEPGWAWGARAALRFERNDLPGFLEAGVQFFTDENRAPGWTLNGSQPTNPAFGGDAPYDARHFGVFGAIGFRL
ncbi:MAG: hypothetical protein AAF654_07900 [Myxococcota bacterium]